MSEAPAIDPINNTLRIEAVKSSVEWSKQITALASGTIVVSGTFIIGILQREVSWRWLILTCWAAMFMSTVLGVYFMSTLCRMLNTSDIKNIDIYSNPPRTVALLHIISFLIGVVTFILFVIGNL
jgi:hypothetical protein